MNPVIIESVVAAGLLFNAWRWNKNVRGIFPALLAVCLFVILVTCLGHTNRVQVQDLTAQTKKQLVYIENRAYLAWENASEAHITRVFPSNPEEFHPKIQQNSCINHFGWVNSSDISIVYDQQ